MLNQVSTYAIFEEKHRLRIEIKLKFKIYLILGRNLIFILFTHKEVCVYPFIDMIFELLGV